MKILYNESIDAKITSVILYQKYALNYGIDIKAEGFQVVNNSRKLNGTEFNNGEYVCIVGVPCDELLYKVIERLILTHECKVLYITNDIGDIGEYSPIDKLFALSKSIDDNGLSLKVIYKADSSLAMMAWIISRYRLEENVTEIFRDCRYSVSDNFEYIEFENEPGNKYSVPWLIRFISDYYRIPNNQIPETNDFMYGIDRMKYIISSHVNWDRLLSDDKEVMQVMTSGIPIREYVERNDLIERPVVDPFADIKDLNWFQRFIKKLFRI